MLPVYFLDGGQILHLYVQNTAINKMNVASIVARDFGDYYEGRIKGGKCARRVREAIESALENFIFDPRPSAACRYVNFFKFWGFTPVFFGFQDHFFCLQTQIFSLE
jgi:membrane-associated protease RseP (regulator of RpoE activity)